MWTRPQFRGPISSSDLRSEALLHVKRLGEPCSTTTAPAPRERAVWIRPQFRGPISSSDLRSEALLHMKRSGEPCSTTTAPRHRESAVWIHPQFHNPITISGLRGETLLHINVRASSALRPQHPVIGRARCGYIRCSTTRSRLRIFAARGCWTGIVRGSNLPSLLPRGATSAVLIHRRFNGPILFGFSARRVRSHRTSSEAVFHKADTSSRKRGTTAPAGRCGSLIGLSGLCEAPVSRETFGRRALHQRFRALSRGHVRSGMGRRVNNFGDPRYSA